ncbi:nitrite reductase small subunit NirD [Aeromonas salmonicida]|uniref:nitrite reductase small subunit NirD n=1 Tax=Aeromonas salmonicida TaxID=645 RepID=UPI000C1C6666|nr:nitrite reductase small subunit NirD [Aeromonas salmonicida]ATU99680.1 nitrite reductase (NAD(P)H) small subunit [Aeromonas salmonicida]
MKLACQLNEIFPGTGVCALLEGRQIALFRPSDAAEVFAIDNRDPFFAANVLSRGLVCEHEGELWVASPLKKQHFRLSDGHCFENPAMSIASYAVEVRDQQVWVAV